MPRTGRGGKRQSPAGRAHGNRTDLNSTAAQPIRAANDPTVHGDQAAALRSQQVVPLPSQAPSASPTGGAPVPRGPMPGEAGPMDRPTEMPLEPATAGAASSPHASSHPLESPTALFLRQLFSVHPDPDIAALLAEIEHRGDL